MQKLNKSRCRFGQASIEYLIVVGLSLLLITPIILLGNRSVVDLKHTSDNILAADAASRIADMANLVYAQGAPAKITEDIRFPSNIDMIVIQDRTIDFKISYRGADYADIFESLDFDITGTLDVHAGTHRVVVEAVAGGVSIREE